MKRPAGYGGASLSRDARARLGRRHLLMAALGAVVTSASKQRVEAQAEKLSGEDDASLSPLRLASLRPQYRLVKSWDFVRSIRDLTALKKEFHTRYIYDRGKQDHLNDEWSRYRDNDNHVFTPRGLSLVARCKGKLEPGAIESGMLRSRWTAQYGIFEIRMKVPEGRGLWPAFWLNPEDQTWPPEIDVVEIVNNGRDTTRRSFHFLHGKHSAGAKPNYSRLTHQHFYRPGFDYSDGFHDFAVEWKQDRVRHFVDERLVVDRPFRWVHDDGRRAGEAHVLVNLAVGGKWPGPPEAKALPAALEIEHIRVWQRKEAT